MIRTAPSTEFFDNVVQRVLARDEQPEGVLMQYSAIHDGELIVGTLFRDAEAMRDTFVRFTSIEVQNQLRETGESFDITRDEYELERLLIARDVPVERFDATPSSKIAAITSELYNLTPEEYREVISELGWFDRPAPGRIAHVAYNHKGSMRSIDFWESREACEAWLDPSMTSRFDELLPGRRSDEMREASWLDVHSLVVSLEPGDPLRDFARTASGPSQEADPSS